MGAALPRRCGLLIVFAAFAVISCSPPPSPVSVRQKETLTGPPDLVKPGAADPRWRSFQLQSFQLNHVWAGSGRAHEDGDYRMKLTVWDYTADGPVAELYFHDTTAPGDNPDPNKSQRPYHLHFPTTAVGPILQTLRNANEPVYLYYFENNWAIGISAREAIGVD